MPKTNLVASLFTGPTRQVGRNTRIFRAGEPALCLWFLASGLVKLTDISTSGDEIVVELYRPGEIFGELCFVVESKTTAPPLSNGPRSTKSRRISWSARFEPGQTPLMELLGELSGRLAAAHGELQALLSQSVLVRLGAKLLDLVAESKTGGDWVDLPHDFHHEELAQMLHVRRETVTRAMTNLKELGLVATGGRGRARIHRPEMRRFVRGKRAFR